MARAPLDTVVRQLRHLADASGPAEATDSRLLQSFVHCRDESGFAALLRRHGPMVLGVARRVLPGLPDAEDVFQATFLLLARKAASIRKPEAVGSWLHGVAHRLALKVRSQAAHRQARERQAATMRKNQPTGERPSPDLPQLLDEELARLPEKYRTALVLCYLEGKTQDEVARQLGCPLGTVRSRLAQGRKLLRGRLVRRGLTLSVEATALALLANGATAAVPPVLLNPTLQAALTYAACRTVPGTLSAQVASLVRAGMTSTVLSKGSVAAALLLVTGLAAVGAGLLAYPLPAHEVAPVGPAGAAPAAALPPPARPLVDNDGDPLPAGAVARLGTLRLRHSGDVFEVAFLSSGVLASHSGDGIRVWDLKNGRQRRLFTGEPFGVRSFALSPDKKVLATTSFRPEGRIQLWSWPGGEHLRELADSKAGYGPLVFSPDGRRIAAGSRDARVHLWDVVTGRELLNLKGHQTSRFDWQNAVEALAFSPDGKRLVTAGKDGIGNGGKIRVWDLADGREAFVLSCDDEPVTSLVFARGGKLLISGGSTNRRVGPGPLQAVGAIRVWDVAARRQLRALQAGQRSDGIVALAVAPDGRTLASGCMDKTVRLWDLDNGRLRRQLREFRNHMAVCYALAFSPDGRTLASGGNDNVVYLWDVTTGRRLFADDSGHEANVRDVAVAPDGRTLVTGSHDGTAALWDLATGKQRSRLRGHEGILYTVALSPDGKVVATGSSDSTLRLWDTATGRTLHTLRASGLDNGQVLCLAFSDDSRFLLSGHMDSERLQNSAVRVWDAATGKALRKFDRLPGRVLAAGFSAGGKVVSVFNSDGQLRRWQTVTGKALASVRMGSPGRWEPVALSADGRRVAVHAELGTVELWDADRGTHVLTFAAPRRLNPVLAISPDGRFLASCYAGVWPAIYAPEFDRKVRVWEIASGKEVVHHAVSAINPVASVTFTPDDRRLVTGMSDGTILVWNLVPPSRARHVRPGDTTRSVASLWAQLAAEDAHEAYAAAWMLCDSPGETVPFLRRHLRPAAAVEPERAARLIADLDSRRFAVRDAAFAELKRLGDEAHPALRKVLTGSPSPEVRRRLETLLVDPDVVRSPDVLRGLRAILVLERIGTPEARRVLDGLARGLPSARLTREAKAATGRLDRRNAGTP